MLTMEKYNLHFTFGIKFRFLALCVCKKKEISTDKRFVIRYTIYIKTLSNGFLYARFYCKYSSNYFHSLKDSIGNLLNWYFEIHVVKNRINNFVMF